MNTILLVDDDVDMSNLTKLTLTKAGYEVALFHESAAGINYAKTEKPDLILMDVMMPGKSGAELVKDFKDDPDLKDIPVMFLTALMSSEEEGVEHLGLNIDGIQYQAIWKPYEIDTLLEKVGNVLNGRTASND